MDRFIPQPGALPQVEDLLNPQRSIMIALGYLLQATVGTATVVDGLSATPYSAGLGVNVGPGLISALTVVDQNAYGTLPADVTDPLLKFGVTISTSQFPLTAPGTPGQSINYLIQAAFLEQYGTPAVLQYYDAANPSAPLSGPGGGGATVNTKISQTVSLQLKAGVAADTGTQATPGVDSGYVGLYIITVNYGATSITTSGITKYPTAPFLPNKLASLRIPVDSGTLNFYVSNVGSDSNPGTNPEFPLATINRALAICAVLYDLTGITIVINLANGLYLPTTIDGAFVNCAVQIIGNTANPDAVTINGANSDCILASNGSNVFVDGITLTATGNEQSYYNVGTGIIAVTDASVIIGANMVFGAVSSSHIECWTGAAISVKSPGPNEGDGYKITGGAGIAHAYAAPGGYISFADSPILIVGNPTFGGAFCVGNDGIVACYAATFTGTAIGSRYDIQANGVIDTNGGGANFLPGNSAGSSSSGGEYI
jgi:hypothetical protein